AILSTANYSEKSIKCLEMAKLSAFHSIKVHKAVEVDKHGGKYSKGEQLMVDQSGNLRMKTVVAAAMEVETAIAAIWLPKE
ncbi:hypothetical protein ACH5RR_040105, partial [Cinchona calisaya]